MSNLKFWQSNDILINMQIKPIETSKTWLSNLFLMPSFQLLKTSDSYWFTKGILMFFGGIKWEYEYEEEMG